MGKRGPRKGTGGRPRSGNVPESLIEYKSKSKQRVRNIKEFTHILARVYVHIAGFPDTGESDLSTSLEISWNILLDNINSKKRLEKLCEILDYIKSCGYSLKKTGYWTRKGIEKTPLLPEEMSNLERELQTIVGLYWKLKNPEAFGDFLDMDVFDGLHYPLPLDKKEEQKQ